MKFARLTAAVVSAALLVGCSEAPVYKTPEIPTPANYKESSTMWQPAQPADQLPRGDWWKGYQDATLNDLVVRLDQANADLAIAVGHFDQATGYAAQARSYLFPTVSTGAYSTRNRQSQYRALRSSSLPYNVYGDQALGLMANYEVDFWGRVRNTVKAGAASAQAAAADLESVHLSLRAELANNYLALRMLDGQSQLLHDEIQAYDKALELTQNRFHGGISSELDVSRAKVELDTAKAKLSDISASRALYEHAVATLVGESASGFSIAPAVVDIQLPAIPVSLPTTLLQRRPDISAAERRMVAANARIGVAKAAFFPTVDLNAAAGYEGMNQAALLTAPSIFWAIGPSALLTIFDAGRREAVVAQAQASFNIAGAEYRSTVLRAFQDVEDNLALLNHLTEESVSISAAVTDTQRTLDIAMNRYVEGVASYLEVVTAQAVAEQVRLNELELRRRRLQASVNLIRALGGGWDSAQMASAP
ncbi:MAG: efflux transporter outer membrane subunit [Gallionella sp.]|jgi:NodT family efflux transporter outer membrane factor (OMF) lipoprotein|nr:efflux transporter outer membrane subunit [Gallionella sp.]